jgi:hypothetical protein
MADHILELLGRTEFSNAHPETLYDRKYVDIFQFCLKHLLVRVCVCHCPWILTVKNVICVKVFLLKVNKMF